MIAAPARTMIAGAGVAGLLVVATLGEGGNSDRSLLVWHGWLLILVLVALFGRRDSGSGPGRPALGPTLGFAVFIGFAAAGALRAPNAYAAWLTLVELASFAAMVWIASSSGRGLVTTGLWILRFAAAAQSLWMIGQRLIGGVSRPGGSFLITNHAAAWVLAVALLSIGAAVDESAGRRRLVFALAVPSIVAVLMTGSRGALIGLVIGALWLSKDVWRRLGRTSRIAVAAVVLIAVVVVGTRQVERVRNDPFIFHRLGIWRAAWSAGSQDPWWGTGPGQFGAAVAAHQFDDKDGPLRFDRSFHTSHSDLLRLPAEIGVTATLALVVSFGLAVAAVRRRRRTSSWIGVDEGAVAAVLAVGAQAAVDNPSQWAATYLLVAALLGRLLRTTPGETRNRWPAARIALGATLILLFVACELRPTLGHLGVEGLPRGALDADQLRRLHRAIDRNPIHPDYRMRLAEHYIDGPIDIDRYSIAREQAETAVRLDPSDGRYAVRLAGIERVACGRLFRDPACGRRVFMRFEEAYRLRPTDTAIPLDAANFALAIGDRDQARQWAERAIRLEPNVVPARLMLAEAVLDDNAQDARRALALIEEAAGIAVEHADDRGESGYARVMLTFDVRRAEGLVRRARQVVGEETP